MAPVGSLPNCSRYTYLAALFSSCQVGNEDLAYACLCLCPNAFTHGAWHIAALLFHGASLRAAPELCVAACGVDGWTHVHGRNGGGGADSSHSVAPSAWGQVRQFLRERSDLLSVPGLGLGRTATAQHAPRTQRYRCRWRMVELRRLWCCKLNIRPAQDFGNKSYQIGKTFC